MSPYEIQQSNFQFFNNKSSLSFVALPIKNFWKHKIGFIFSLTRNAYSMNLKPHTESPTTTTTTTV